MKKGFTFIELLIYLGIVSIVLSSLVQFAWNAVGGGIKSNTEQEVYATARYVSERIKYEIRNAKSLTSVSGTSISYVDVDGTSSTIAVSGTKIQINKGSAINLNSTDTNASITFTDYSSTDTKTKHVGFILTVQSNYGSTRQEYIDSVSLRGSAEMRSN